MKRIGSLFFVWCLILVVQVFPLGVDLGKPDLSAHKIRILVGEDNSARQKILDNLKADFQNLETKTKDFLEAIQKKITDVKQHAEQLKKDSKSEISIRKIAQLNKLAQVLLDICEAKKQILETLKQHIEFWEKYFSSNGKLISRVEDKSLYSFFDLQIITKKIALEEEERLRLISKKEEEDAALHRQEHQVVLKDKEIKQIEKEIEELKKQADDKDIKEEVDLLDLDKEVATRDKELADIRIDLHQKEADFYDSRIILIQDHLKILREDMNLIRTRLHIDKSEEQRYQQKNEAIRKEVNAKKSRLVEQKNKWLEEKSRVQGELELLSNRHRIPLSNIRQVQDWEIDAETIASAYAAYSVSYENLKLTFLERLLYKLKGDSIMLDARVEQAQVLFDTVKTLYGITQGQFKGSDYLEKERVSLKDLKQTVVSDIKKYKAEVSAAHAFIKDQYKAIANIKKQQEKIKTIPHKAIASSQKKYDDIVQMLSFALQKHDAQKDVSVSISELYTQLTDIKEETLENVNFMLQELDQMSGWHRATHAMTWAGFKNVMPNVKLFIKAVSSTIISYVASFNIKNIVYQLSQISFAQIFFLCLLLFIIFVLFAILQTFLPSLYRTLMVTSQDQQALYGINRFFAVFVGFVNSMLQSLFVWLFFLAVVVWIEPSVPIMLGFYVYSIVFWIYASRVFLKQFLQINQKSRYVLLNQRLTDRFSLIFSFFSISTVLILFFRKMFMLVMTYQQSEFPDILLRLYHVVIFISIVFSIDKEELLQLLPKQTKLGQQFYLFVQKYYYIFLMSILGVLVMSDPYLGGYGSLIWYIFWNTLFTVVILGVLFFLHRVIRQYTSFLFFQEDDAMGGSNERFEHAKAWYGFYVIVLFLAFFLAGVVICSHVWGYGFTLDTLNEFLNWKFTIEYGEKLKPVRIKDILAMCGIILSGFFVVYLFRKFVLEKIFEIHYVDPGIQNTVSTISRYIIMFIFLMIGLINANLGFLVSGLWVLSLVAFGFAFKDLFTDVGAYFFILVQRPLKLGDFVKLDANTMGVVRKISPRAVILRRKNAVNIVVPNSTVLKSSMYNWNYTRSYIGFSDIVFSVPFGVDVRMVKELLLKILDEHSEVLKVPQPIVRLDDFSDKGYVFMVRGFLSSGNTLRQWEITSGIRFTIVEKLAQEGIQIAAPSFHIQIQQAQKLNVFDQM